MPSKRVVLVILAVVAVLLIGSAYREILPGRLPAVETTKPGLAQVKFGGPFSLVDQQGKPVTERSFHGRYMLVYFGYTYCPDVCPTGLQIISNAIDLLGPEGDRVRPVFITIDPERDTPDILSGYVGAFHPRMAGLTGTAEQVALAAKSYNARYIKFFPMPVPGEDSPENENDNYHMQHTTNTYLVGPDGTPLVIFAHGTDAETMAKRILRFINNKIS